MTWKKFKEISDKIKCHSIAVSINGSKKISFSSMEKAIKFYRNRGAITIEELDNNIRNMLNDENNSGK